MSRLLCCLRARHPDMGAALSHPQEGEACEGAGVPAAPPTMADVIRERKKKAGGAGLGTLRRRIAAAARRPRDNRPDRGGCEHARLVRATVSSWRLAEVFLVCEELEAGAALRDLLTRAELAREPAAALHADLAAARADRLWCDVELVGAGWSLPAHRVILSARCTYFRDLLQRYPPGRCRVVLEGACAALQRDELAACLCALYSGKLCCDLCTKYDRVGNSDADLDIINTENTNSLRRTACSVCGSGSGSGGNAAAAEGRLAALSSALGFFADSLHRDMKYLLDSGELSDTRLVFVSEGGGGFRTALDLNAHRLLLAARSRFFRGVLSRRSTTVGGSGAAGSAGNTNNGTGSVLCVDEKVLPRRFARALLHAAYTDQVDLSLIGRNSSSPSSAAGAGSGTTGWAGVTRGSGSTRGGSAAVLEDAFALYEIGRFLEMPIVVQGCEDAIVEALSPETLPQVLRWSSAPHASQWVHRQGMRYLRDEFSSIMCSSASGRIPRAALAAALASPFLQAAELHALRALLRWAAAQHAHSQHSQSRPVEPNVVWHTAHAQAGGGGSGGGGGGIIAGVGGGRRGAGGRRREASEAALRDTLAPLLPLLRIEHLPPDTDLLHQLVRRGILPSEVCERPEAGTADAWLGRGACRPARCFLPYLDEMKALLEDQAVPEAEIARMRRERYLHRIPDTLYMVAAARGGGECRSGGGGGGGGGGTACAERWCVSARTVRALRVRVRELCAAQPQLRALALHRADPLPVYTQIALRAVREMSLPDSCAELLLADVENERERGCEGWQTPPLDVGRGERGDRSDPPPDCCRSGSGCSASGGTAGTSSRSGHSNHLATEGSRAGSCRRELSGRPPDSTRSRNRARAGFGAEWSGGGRGGGSGGGARLSAAVPDVAMAPNANTHLLTSRDYFRHQLHSDYCGLVLQLDLGDGATHTPRPGSRAQRANALAHTARHTNHTQSGGGMSCVRGRQEEDELRAAIELSLMRAYSSLEGGGSGGGGAAVAGGSGGGGSGATSTWRSAHLPATSALSTLPHRHRPDLQVGARTSAPAMQPGAGGVGGGSGVAGSMPLRELHTPPLHLTPRTVRQAAVESHSPTPSAGHSPRRHHYSLYARHDYTDRLEPTYGGSGSTSRGHSPNNYA